MYMTGIGLLLAAFIELRTQQLSLLDGLVVSLMGTIMFIFTIASRSLFTLIKQREDSDMGWSLYFAKPESVPEAIRTVYIWASRF
ncbi:unnamed protein product [Rhizoctonia solani]|uniref:Uncharacterized protein n=1 Tax=Rhizoctonia solani TaxID=456999 RepID=A0A8H3CDH9_9AGAM|nr:unnamed protein product [Rhizoctonia solani]CAE6480256.1 unnamed protein product [Rhizoctonia solani]